MALRCEGQTLEKKKYQLSAKLSVTFFSEQSVGMTLAQRYDWSGTPLRQGRALPRRIYRLPPLPLTSLCLVLDVSGIVFIGWLAG